MMGTINCVYETPYGWCSKWDKKCDKKTPERGQRAKCNPIDDAAVNKMCQDESNFVLELYDKILFYESRYGEGFIVKIFMNRKAISICCTSPNFMFCNTEGINYMCVGIPVEVYSDGKDTPEYYFGVR